MVSPHTAPSERGFFQWTRRPSSPLPAALDEQDAFWRDRRLADDKRTPIADQLADRARLASIGNGMGAYASFAGGTPSPIQSLLDKEPLLRSMPRSAAMSRRPTGQH